MLFVTFIEIKDLIKKEFNKIELFFVGVAGFEPTTSTSQMWRDTGLRYTPIKVSPFCFGDAKIE